MLNHKKIAAISWLVGGLSLAGVGISHAVAVGSAPQCTSDAQGNQTCVTKSDSTYTSDDGRIHIHQVQNCTTESRDDTQTPEIATGQPGTTHIGAVVECSNHAPVPEGFTAPDIKR